MNNAEMRARYPALTDKHELVALADATYAKLAGSWTALDAICLVCYGHGTVRCGSMHPGWCENDGCRGECLVACGACTGEGHV